MIKTLIQFTEQQNRWLRGRAKERSIPLTEVIRQLVQDSMPVDSTSSAQPARQGIGCFETTVRGKWMYEDCVTPAEMAQRADAAASGLRALAADGVWLKHPVSDDHALLFTDDAKIAKRHGMSKIQ